MVFHQYHGTNKTNFLHTSTEVKEKFNEKIEQPTATGITSDRSSCTHWFLLACFAHFQHDAACRVIARLKKERDESRTLLAQAERQIPISAAGPAPVAAVTNGKRGFHRSNMSKANFFVCFALILFP